MRKSPSGVENPHWQFLEKIRREEECQMVLANEVFLPKHPKPLRVYDDMFQTYARESGRYLTELLRLLEVAVQPGVSPIDLEKIARDFFQFHASKGILPAFLGVDGYPNCISVTKNNCIFHGHIDDVPFVEGDVITIDSGVNYRGANTDAAVSQVVGMGLPIHHHLVHTLQQALKGCLPLLVPGETLYQQGVFFLETARNAGLHLIRDCNGHGVGANLHEDPWIVHWPAEYLKQIVLQPGNIFTLEPIFTETSDLSISHGDDFVGYTKFGDFGAYREITILMTESGAEVIAGVVDNYG